MQYSQKIFTDSKKLLYAWFLAMFTRVDVLISTDATRDDLVYIAEQIKTEIERVELFANRFDENSEISLINSTAFIKPRIVSAELFAIIEECRLFNQKTLGHFDITVNSVNGYKDGMKAILLNADKQTIRFLHPDVRLDLSGYIKGYVLRAIRKLLEKENIHHALINIGNSSILAMGNHPCGEGWKISFSELTNKTECVLHNEYLTTSGNKEQTKWPILQPHTAQPIIRTQSVSIISDDPAIGEALSIALYIANKNEKHVILSLLKGKEINVE